MLKTLDSIVIKIRNSKNQSYGTFEKNYLGKTIVPIGSRIPTKKGLGLEISTYSSILFVAEDENNASSSKRFYIGTLHDLILVSDGIPDYYLNIAVDDYDLQRMKTVYVTTDLKEIKVEEFIALTGKFHQYKWQDEKGGRKRFEPNKFLCTMANRVYLSK